MNLNPFVLPVERGALLKKLSEKGGGHGEMMAKMMGGTKDEKPDPEALWQSLLPSAGRPLVIYLHVPFCISRCSFCGFYRNRVDDAALEAYTVAVLKEIDRVADEGRFTSKPVDVVYFGGGTPTALTADQLSRIVGRLYERFTISPEVEFTVEGRLYAFDDDRVRACLESGVNRFSFGVQSFETKLRQSLGRRYTREETLTRLKEIKDICQDRMTLVADLIYGLPGQTQEDWMERNVKTVDVESALDAVDLYSLKTIPGTPLAKRLEEEGGWSEEERLMRHAEASNYLAAHGWEQLSTTHWGRRANGHVLERNRYNTVAKIVNDMIPFGCGAGGFIGDYAIMQNGSLEAYHRLVADGLKPIGMIAKTPTFMGAQKDIAGMTDLGYFDPKKIPGADFSSILANWEEAGVWTRRADDTYRLTRLGEYYLPKLNSLLMGLRMAQSATGPMAALAKKVMGL